MDKAPPSPPPGDAQRQFSLDFPAAEPGLDDLIEGAANAAALARLRRWPDWPDVWLAVTGPPKAGLTVLARAFADRYGLALLRGAALAGADMAAIDALARRGVVLDDADGLGDGAVLLQLLNAAREHERPVVLFAHTRPADWDLRPRDVMSRLRAMAVVEIAAPDEAMMRARLSTALRQRFIFLGEDVSHFLVMRLARSYADVEAVAERIDRTMRARQRELTVALAREVLGGMAEADGQAREAAREAETDGDTGSG